MPERPGRQGLVQHDNMKNITVRPRLKQAIIEQQLSYLSYMGGPAYFTNVVIALIITYVYWQREPLLASTLSIIIIAISTLRYIFFRLYTHSSQHDRDYEHWSRMYLLGSTFTGLAWGTGLLLFANYLGGIDFFIILTVTIIVSAIGFISLSSDLRAVLLFFYPLMLPITLSCFLYYTSPLMLATGIMLVVYLIVAGFLSAMHFRHFVLSVIYQQRNLMLKHRLENSNQELQHANEKLEALSATDALTGLANRRHFDHFLEREMQQARREHSPLAMILLDIDYFKSYNDNYGHLAGDEALVKVARAISGSLTRPMDLAARYGGEEFVVVLPCTDMLGAIRIAERIQKNIRALQLRHEYTQLPDKLVTVSMGISEMRQDENQSSDDFIHRVDMALYVAKEAGRNTYITDLPEEPETSGEEQAPAGQPATKLSGPR